MQKMVVILLCVTSLKAFRAYSTPKLCSKAFQEEQTLSLFIRAEEIKNHPHLQELSPHHRRILSSIDKSFKNWEKIKGPLSTLAITSLTQDIERLETALKKYPSTEKNQAEEEVENQMELAKDQVELSKDQGYETQSHQRLEESVENQTHQLQWLDLVNDPSLIQANKAYPIQWPNNQSANVFFDPLIVQTFFNPSKKSSFRRGNNQQIAQKNLRAIMHGWTTGGRRSGLRTLRRSMKRLSDSNPKQKRATYNQLFEVRVVGSLAGHVRIGGFVHQNNLYIVHYDTGKHRIPFINALKEKQSVFLSKIK